MTNQERKVRPEIVNVNSNEPVFCPFSIKTSKCSGSCNNINNLYAKMCVPDVDSVKVFNLMSRTNETRPIEWHETCKCKCRLNACVCNNTQRWNDDKCRCECKELIDKGVCDKGSIWIPSNCQCECDKSCDVGEYLDYENWNCRKKLVESSSAEECTENIDEAKIAKINSTELYSTENIHKCSSYILNIVLLSIMFTTNIGIAIYFTYYKYMNHNKKTASRYNYVYQATNYLYKWEISQKVTLKIKHYFFYDMINIKDFDSSLLKINKKSYKNIGTYNYN